MPGSGRFADARLTPTPWDLPDGLPGFVADHREALGHWGDEEMTGLDEVAQDAQLLLDTVERHCLVHSDLNPKNWLVDPDTLEIAALLDWEFAHAGHPWSDLGNLLRFQRDPSYAAGVLGAWTTRHGGAVDALLDGARAADLWALVDLASRERDNPVAGRSATLLRAVARAGDVHAWPGTS